MFRTRLSLTRLEERETPSDIAPPMDPSGGTTTSPTDPAQTTTPPSGTTNPIDPYGTSP